MDSRSLIPRLASKQGNTLIEMLTVIVILGIMLALAAPYVLGDVHRSQDTQTKQSLALAFNQLKKSAITSSSADCFPYDPPCIAASGQVKQELQTTFPLLSFQVGLPSQSGAVTSQIGVETDAQNEAVLCVKSPSGNFFSIRYVTSGLNSGTYYGAGDSCTDGSRPATPGIPYDTSSGPNPTPAAQGTNETSGDEWTTGGGSSGSGGGGAGGGTTIANPLNTTKPSISGNPGDSAGSTLTVSTGSWDARYPPTSYTYQWLRDGLTITGATATSYVTSAPDMNSHLSVQVTAKTDAGGQTTVTTTPFLVANPPSGASGANAPTISGQAQDLQTLAASTGTWSGTPTFTYSYQWQRSATGTGGWTDLSGATSSTFLIGAARVGDYLRVAVTATNAAGSATSYSSATSQVTNAPPQNPGGANAPSISDSNGGTLYQGDTLTADTGTWNGTGPITFTYQWLRCDAAGANCVAIPGATASTYQTTNADIGSTIRVIVTGSGPGGSTSVTSGATALVEAKPPANAGGANSPSISGGTNAVQGSTLSAANGTWSGTLPITYSYQWQRCDENGNNCIAIPGATSSSYSTGAADVGYTLRVVVGATNAGGSASSTTAASGLVGPATPANAGGANLPANSNLDSYSPPRDEDRLTTTNGVWTGTLPVGYLYDWKRCDSSGNSCVSIPGAGSAQMLTNAGCESGTGAWNPINATLVQVASPAASGSASCRVNASGPGTYGADQAVAVAGQTAGRIYDGMAAIYATGSSVGETFQLRLAEEGGASASASTSATTTLRAGWNYLSVTRTDTANDRTAAHLYVEILGGSAADHVFLDAGYLTEHRSIYTLTPADIGSTIRSTVSATNAAGSTPATSSQSQVIVPRPLTNLSSPTISDGNGGQLFVGDNITSTNGSWDGSPTVTYTYQWQDGTSPTGPFTDIASATSQSYTPTNYPHNDIDLWLRVCTTAHNTATPPSATSCSTTLGPVLDIPRNTSAPTTGTSPAIWGQQTTETNGSWTGTATITYSYQWQRCNAGGTSCSDIPAATGTSYTPADADVAQTLRVVVTGTNGYGTTSATSAATPVNAAPPTNTAAPTVSGSTQAGQTLSSSNGSWSPNGDASISYSYQWQACSPSCSNIGGATGSSYTISRAYTGQTIRLLVTATNSGGSTTSASSQTGGVTGYTPSETTSGYSYSNGDTSATVYGQVTDPGAASANWQINFGAGSPSGQVNSGSTGVNGGSYSAGVGGLAYNTTYYWNICAQNSWASSCSGAASFTTSPPQDCDGDFDGSNCYTNVSASSAISYDSGAGANEGGICTTPTDGDDYQYSDPGCFAHKGFAEPFGPCNGNNNSANMTCVQWSSDAGDSGDGDSSGVQWCQTNYWPWVAPSSGWQEYGSTGAFNINCYSNAGVMGYGSSGPAYDPS
jgi:prepilin-type N-terminal cleavage/methylation domain-containing protein